MKKKLLILGAAVAVIAAALAVLLLSLDVNQFRPRIQAELQTRLGRPVTLGDMGLSILPLAIRVSDIGIGESAKFPTSRPFVTAKQLRVRVGLLPLLRKEVEVRSLVLDRPAIELVRNAAGEWNYSDLGGSKSGEQGGGGFSIGSLEIRDGALAVGTLGAAASRSVYDHIDVKLLDYAPGKNFRLDAGARLPGSGRNSLTLEARGGPVGAAEPEITGRLGVRDASLAGLQKFLAAKSPSQVDGLISGDADLHLAKSVATVRGAMEMRNTVVDGRSLQYPLVLDYDVASNLQSGLLKIGNLKLTVGNVPILASGEMNTKTSTADVRVRVSRASLAEVLAAARAFGGDGVGGSGTVSLDVRAQGSLEKKGGLSLAGSGALENASITTPALTKPLQVRTANLRFDNDAAKLENLACSLGSSTMKGSLSVRNFAAPDVGFALNIDKLDLAEVQQLTNTPQQKQSKGQSSTTSTGALSAKGTVDVGSILYNGLVLNRVHSDCTLSRGVLTLAPLTAEVYGGKQSGSLTLDTRVQPPVLTVNTKLDSVDANQLLSATTSVKKTLYGLLAAQGDARMALAPGAEAVRTMNGNLSIRLAQGKLTGINLLNEMSSLGKFVGYAQKSEPYTNILQLAGDIAVKDGVANTDNLRLQIEGATVAAAGAINLVNDALNLKLTAVLDRSMSQKVGGTSVGGYLSTALANDKGELVIPAVLTGTFAQPRFAPDTSRVAEMKLKNLLPTSGNPGALTSGIVGALKGQKGAGRSVLDALTGKPAQQQPAAEPAGAQQAQPAAGAAPQEPPKKRGILGGVLDTLRKQQEKQQEKQQPKQ